MEDVKVDIKYSHDVDVSEDIDIEEHSVKIEDVSKDSTSSDSSYSETESENEDRKPDNMKCNQQNVISYTFECSLCKYGTQVRLRFRRHMKTHSSQKTYKCEKCSKGFRIQRELKIHMAEHSGRPLYKCDICAEKYLSRRYLISHKNDVHFINTNRASPEVMQETRQIPGMKYRYKCEFCNFMGQFRGTINQHIKNYHRQEKKYKCKLCPLMFNEKQWFTSHIRKMHADANPNESAN